MMKKLGCLSGEHAELPWGCSVWNVGFCVAAAATTHCCECAWGYNLAKVLGCIALEHEHYNSPPFQMKDDIEATA